ncbi:MAG: cytochrome b/b6 domain-containing protein [Pseudomonadales bacterium]|nr:cytochrome b/b6 domain-containing protein [Pseudomonadales bacterium]
MKGFQLEKVWDRVSRLWHWVLVLTICISWWLGEYMEFDTIDWHFYVGYVVLGLMGFRFFWGFVGPSPIRFRALIPTPSQAIQYLKRIGHRQPSGSPGHNPIGSLSVIAMLVSITMQAVTGMFIESDDFFESAPLAAYVSDETMGLLTWWHHLNAKIILVLVCLHLLAILFYLIWKKENLIKPMITGWKWVRTKKSDES